ncbi:uncharacterized protein LOC114280909 [Camellia sinensis]|uniref:uncharacterized protein LOC114280909 n=1 Tax=Camellia sinensis TaxID=4442 RepID=UPI001036DA1D|nr:uncharacterized protein LOC114280909 [Camellia sinensis]
MNSTKQYVPGFKIFFNLKLQDSDAKEKTEPNIDARQSMESGSNNSELGVGAALACLLSDPPADSESLGDNLTISTIGDQLSVNPSSSILDALEAPSLVWKLEKGYLSSSKSDDELESDPTESVELDSGSSEGSESSIPGGGNSDAKVLSMSSFSFAFEFVVTEEVDLLNENSTDFEYFSIKEKVTKQIEARFILVYEYPTWLANIVPVPKKDGIIRVCVDFRDLNKASPKDDFPLPHIDELVDFTMSHVLLSLMDGFFGYNQILMAPEDSDKTVFTML